MDIESSIVTKLKLSKIENLDPITVILEDIAPAQGKIIIECFGKSWSAYWGGMGSCTLPEFFAGCDNSYLINCLERGISSTVRDYDNIDEWLKKGLIERRNEGELTKDEARKLWDEIGYECENHEHWLHTGTGYSIAQKCHGEEFWYDLPEIENHEYVYLSRIVDAVRNGLKTHFTINPT